MNVRLLALASGIWAAASLMEPPRADAQQAGAGSAPTTGEVAYQPPLPPGHPDLRRVRLRGADAVFRLERPGFARSRRPAVEVPIVVCREAPCAVDLPEHVSLAIQYRGHRTAVGLRVPSGDGTLVVDYERYRGRRLLGGIGGAVLFVAGLAALVQGLRVDQSDDPGFVPPALARGIGGGLMIAGSVTALLSIFWPPRPEARWIPAPGTWR
ncbi:MAG: hypothetical protein CMN30_28010 [Sandaracinus sp.]|nr:hypothetical protein [Sandaracinus sp.]|tara:strand:- start:751 stop:1383 length:633 start_codon:yes stop_codon:yes gene_type:complete